QARPGDPAAARRCLRHDPLEAGGHGLRRLRHAVRQPRLRDVRRSAWRARPPSGQRRSLPAHAAQGVRRRRRAPDRPGHRLFRQPPHPRRTNPPAERGGLIPENPMLAKTYPYYLANQPQTSKTMLDVFDKYSGKLATRVAMPDAKVTEKAIAAAVKAAKPMREFKPWARQAVLQHCADRFSARRDELAEALCIEAGKPIKDAAGEVTRLIETFRIAAEESVRINGETINLELAARLDGYHGYTKRVPLGPVSFITPFNFPLNLVAHKVAPAIAAGCPFVLKPSEKTPIGALIIGEVLAETDLPRGAFSILPLDGKHAAPLVEDERFKLLSFTGG